jgi:hypothetical protein
METIKIGEDSYDVIRRIVSKDTEKMKQIKGWYSDVYADLVLLKSNKSTSDSIEYILCRKIEDGDFEEVKPEEDIFMIGEV